MHAFEVTALVDQRRADREREARLERMRRVPIPTPPPPRAAEPVLEPVAAPCPGAACGHPSAA